MPKMHVAGRPVFLHREAFQLDQTIGELQGAPALLFVQYKKFKLIRVNN